jgi:hypothetical protein
MNKDLEFLAGLNEKLHGIQKETFTPNLFGDPFPVYFDTYTNECMNEEEIKEVLNISKRDKYSIYPINTAMGFSVGYDICEILSRGERKVLLRFKEGQLPKKYTFKEMSKTFMSKENLKKAKFIGEKIEDYEHYTY